MPVTTPYLDGLLAIWPQGVDRFGAIRIDKPGNGPSVLQRPSPDGSILR